VTATSTTESPSPDELRAAQDGATLRIRDLATQLGVSEAELVASRTGRDVTRIAAGPDALVGGLEKLGTMMALTRNESAVSEVSGTYSGYQSGEHACMVLGDRIDLRIFPQRWVHGFAVEAETGQGIRRSFQVFDRAGDAVHKMYLPLDADPAGWQALRDRLALDDQSDRLQVKPRSAVQGAIEVPEKAEKLREEWDRLTDTHQFMLLTRKLKINRLGAYRMAGAPYARRLAPEAVATALNALSDSGTPAMIFIGNMGCIQIFSGSIGPIKPMGPWLNVLDPGFDLHLRGDHVAEVWLVEKPTRRGPAISLEAFDAEGGLIGQIFGYRTKEQDHYAGWTEIVNSLPGLVEAAQ